MNAILFSIIFSAVMIGILVILIGQYSCVSIVKAGKVTDFELGKNLSSRSNVQNLKFQNKIMDASNMIVLKVKGDSMQKYEIFDDDLIAVKPYSSEEEKVSLSGHPVLVIKITPSTDSRNIGQRIRYKLDGKYKLRKFIGYVPDVHSWDADDMYKQFGKTLIKTSINEFREQSNRKVQRIAKTDDEQYLLSETFDCAKGKIDYSFHKVSDIYAKAEYVLER